MDAYLVGTFVAIIAVLMGYIGLSRRKVAQANLDRQRVKDSLQLIDTQTKLKSADEQVRESEAKREQAVDNYTRNMWRPGSDSEPHG